MTLYERTIKEVQAKARSERYSPYFYALDFDVRPPSVANLPAEMTIAGVTKTPDFRYTGRSCSASGWPSLGYGPNLTLTNPSYTAPTYDTGSPLMGDIDGSVTGNGTGAVGDTVANFQGGTGDCDIGTKDVVFEVVLLWPAVAPTTAALYAVKKDSGGTVGWDVRIANNRLEFYLAYSSSYICISSATLSTWPSVWSHAMCFIDRSGSGQWYVNGTAWVSAVDVSSGVSWDCSTSGKPFCLLSPWNGSYGFNGALAYCALWSHSGWLNTHLQPAIAFSRFSQMQGLEAIVCPQGSSLPTTKTRNSTAYLDKYEADGTRKLWQISGSWIRGCERPDTGGVKRRGVLVEKQVTNKAPYGRTFASWVIKGGVTAPTTSVLCIDGTTRTTVTMAEDGTNGQHYGFHYITTYQSQTVQISVSAFCKRVKRNVKLSFVIGNTGGDAFWGTFNLATGAVGTTGTGTYGSEVLSVTINAHRIYAYADGWYRCEVVATVEFGGTMDTYYTGAFLLDDSLVTSFQGVAGDSLYLDFVQVEDNCAHMSSPIGTTVATAIRYADSLAYRADVLPPDGGAVLHVAELCPDQTYSAARVLLCCDGGDINNIAVLQHAANAPRFDVRSGGGGWASVSGSTDTMDGDEHEVAGLYKTNLAQLYVDGTKEGTDDTSVTVPVSLASVRVGAYTSAGSEADALISKVRID